MIFNRYKNVIFFSLCFFSDFDIIENGYFLPGKIVVIVDKFNFFEFLDYKHLLK